MARRLSILLTLLLGALIAGTSPASAAPAYPSEPAGVTVSSTEIGAGGSLTARACGFEPGSTVTSTVRINGRSRSGPSGTAGPDGCVTLRFTLVRPGEALLSFSGTGGDGNALVVTARVTVRGSGDSSGGTGGTGGGLPRTGGNLTALWAGVALLIAGGALVGVTRTRRSRVSA